MECLQSCSAFSCVGYLTELKMEASKELFRSLGSNTAKIYEIYGPFSFLFPPTTRVENNNIYESLAQSLQQLQKSTASRQPSFPPAMASASASPTSPQVSQVGGGTVTTHNILQCALSKLISLLHEFPVQNKKITRHRL